MGKLFKELTLKEQQEWMEYMKRRSLLEKNKQSKVNKVPHFETKYPKIKRYMQNVKTENILIYHIFCSFLISNKIIDRFEENLEHLRKFSKGESYYFDLINNAFTWVDTPEKRFFWEKMSMQWLEEYSRFNMIITKCEPKTKRKNGFLTSLKIKWNRLWK